jgi:hypothetical protein
MVVLELFVWVRYGNDSERYYDTVFRRLLYSFKISFIHFLQREKERERHTHTHTHTHTNTDLPTHKHKESVFRAETTTVGKYRTYRMLLNETLPMQAQSFGSEGGWFPSPKSI